MKSDQDNCEAKVLYVYLNRTWVANFVIELFLNFNKEVIR